MFFIKPEKQARRRGSVRRDERAASPLVVIGTVLLVAVGVTALVVFLSVDRGAALDVQLIQDGKSSYFQVTDVTGSQSWRDLEVRFISPSGTDRADLYLDLEGLTGPVRPGDTIDFIRTPPAGTYLLQINKDGSEQVRLSVPL